MTDARGLGAYLRRCREARGLSVDDVSAATRIVPRLLRALEDDRLEGLSASVYVRGFIRTYCDQVGVPPEPALRLDETPLQGGQSKPGLVPVALPAPKPRPARFVRGSPGRFTVTVGNARVRLELDGEALPALGNRGETR